MAKANRALLITPAFLKANSRFDANVTDVVLRDCIRTAEDIYLMPKLGSQLCQAVSDKVENNTLSGTYETLLEDYISPALLKYAHYEYLCQTFKIKNKGNVKENSANSVPADKDDIFVNKSHILDTAEFYSGLLINYLVENSSSFPEYYSYVNISDIPPATKAWSSGIVYPDRKLDNDRGKGIGYGINF
jgi:hypothetical protein